MGDPQQPSGQDGQGGDNNNNKRAEDSAVSPTDTRNTSTSNDQPRGRDAASTNLSESFQSTETVRRRPDGSNTAGYGSISTPARPSMSSSQTLDPTHDRSTSHSRDAQGTRSPMVGPTRAKSWSRLRKPPMSRRTSSTTPRKGDVFSVEDDPDEVDADTTSRQRGSTSEQQGQGLRRRTQGSAGRTLSRVQSHRSQEPGDENENRDNDLLTVEDEDEDAAESDLPLDEHLDCDSDSDISDAESFTLKDRQQAINQTHPFGIRVWKPALYKKDRSIQKFALADIHSSPGLAVSNTLLVFNVLWTVIFGWWLALLAAFGAIICLLFSGAASGREYGRVLWGLAGYLFYPFGKFVRLEKDEAYMHEDQDEGRSISEYEQWQSGDLEHGRLFFGPDGNRSIVGRSRRSIDSEPSETESLLGRRRRGEGSDSGHPTKRRLFGRGEWNVGRVIFFVFFYFLISPFLLLVSAVCWFFIFSIPMGKVTMLLFDHLRRHPLALAFESDIRYARADDTPSSSILLCTYRAVGWKYWKYTVDGTNIFLINLMAVVFFVIFDYLVLEGVMGVENFFTSPAFLFTAGLFSIIPLAYFIGQAVASISAQSSMGLGAAVNAFFATVVEVFLYCVALKDGKGALVEGSIVGSIFAGILFLPGISMCFGAIKRKTQRFNAKSAGVTSTMLLFAVVGAFGPTLFYQIYGTHELNCLDCEDFDSSDHGQARDCRRCYFSQVPSLDDRFYNEAVRPYCYIAACLLFFSYLIGLWFTLRTHAAVIWNTEVEEKRHEEQMHANSVRASQQTNLTEASPADIRETHLYKRIYGQTAKQAGLASRQEDASRKDSGAGRQSNGAPTTPHVVPPKASGTDTTRSRMTVPGLSEADNSLLVHEVAQIAATAAAIASRERVTRKHSGVPSTPAAVPPRQSTAANTSTHRPGVVTDGEDDAATVDPTAAGHSGGGHDAPNWGRTKSTVILLGATVLYAIVAEILVDTVDVVLENFAIDQKFLGITLFALVPNTTEFLNAISFAMNGNIALSMEIGSAYALQVCLLQIPALVLFSALYPGVPPEGVPAGDSGAYIFTLLFPQFDMVTVILCVFLLSYMYGEGKSNYFKGSILMLTYLVVIVGFYFSGYTKDAMGTQRFDTMQADGTYQTFKTIGRSTSGQAF